MINLYGLLYTHSNVYLSAENIIFIERISNIKFKNHFIRIKSFRN